MQELIKALTRAANAVAEYYEKQSNPLLPLYPTMAEEKAAQEAALKTLPPQESTLGKTRKPRGPNKEKPITAAETIAALPAQEMTEPEAVKAAEEVNRMLVKQFAKPVDGRPEGFHIARKILAEDFKVEKMAQLAHAQRLQYITKVRALLAQAPAAAPAPVGDATGIGV